MDKGVIIKFATVTFIALITLVYQSSFTCIIPEFALVPENPFVGQEVNFRSLQDSDPLIWDFGDGSDNGSGNEVSHVFASSGKYQIRVKSVEGCETVREIVVAERVAPVRIVPDVQVPSTITAGSPVRFSEETGKASTWKWTIEGIGEGSGRSYSTTFPKPGRYTLNVQVSGETVYGDTTLVVEVVRPAAPTGPAPRPRPPVDEPTPPPSPPPSASRSFDAKEFIDVANRLYEDDNASDEYQALASAFCGGIASKVKVISKAGEEDLITLGSLSYKLINSEGKVTVKEVKDIDKTGKCIRSMTVVITE